MDIKISDKQIETNQTQPLDLEDLKEPVNSTESIVINCNEVGEYSEKALDCLTRYMNRVTNLACLLENGDELNIVNYTNILCRLANEIKYIEECEEIDNEFCSLGYDNGETQTFEYEF